MVSSSISFILSLLLTGWTSLCLFRPSFAGTLRFEDGHVLVLLRSCTTGRDLMMGNSIKVELMGEFISSHV